MRTLGALNKNKIPSFVCLEFCESIKKSDRKNFPFLFLDDRATQPQWLMSRIAISRLLYQHKRDPRESLSLSFPNKNFSISHKRNFSVALYLKGNTFQGCGVDLELAKKIPQSHWHFFMTSDEILKINKNSKLKASQLASRVWAIKEALLKSDMENDGKFLKDYPLENFMKAQGSFRIKNKKYKYFCIKKRAHYLALAYLR